MCNCSRNCGICARSFRLPAIDEPAPLLGIRRENYLRTTLIQDMQYKSHIRKSRFLVKTFTIMAVVGLLPLLALSAPGALDASYGNSGTVIANFSFYTGPFDIKAMARQQDGKFVVAGQCNTLAGKAGCLVRTLADGSIDNAFGNGGTVILENEFVESSFNDMSIDGTRVITVGTCKQSNVDSLCVSRFLETGMPDASFASTGRLLLQISGNSTKGNALAIDNMGRYVIGGACNQAGTSDFCIVRLTTSGILDASFGSTGVVSFGVGAGEDAVNALALSGSQIVASGTCHNGTQNKMCVARINGEGSLDMVFGSAGKMTLDLGMSADTNQSLIVHQGKIYVSGLCNSSTLGAQGCVARLVDTGALDTSFNSQGFTMVSSSTGMRSMTIYTEVTPSGFGFSLVKTFLAGAGDCDQRFCVLLFQLDGSYYGNYGMGNSFGYYASALLNLDSSLAVAGLCPSGTFFTGFSCIAKFTNYTTTHFLDSFFGFQGRAKINIGKPGAQDTVFASVATADGKLAIAGECFAPEQDACVARFLPNGLLDASFAGKGYVPNLFGDAGILDISAGVRRRAKAIAIDGSGMIVAGVCKDAACLVRLTENGARDTNFGSNGLVLVPLDCSTANVYDEFVSVAISNGAIAVSTGCVDPNGSLGAIHFRLLSNGGMDPGFNGGAVLRTNAGPVGGYQNGLKRFATASAGGKLVVAGSKPGVAGFVVSRFEPNGSADLSFGTGGMANFPAVPGAATAVAVTGQQVIAAGRCTSGSTFQFCAIRLHADGSLDTSFGYSGVAYAQPASDVQSLTAVSIHGEKIVLSGLCTLLGSPRFCVAVLNPDGFPDATFGTSGVATFSAGSYATALDAHAVANGHVFLAGTCQRVFGAYSDACILKVELPSPTAIPNRPGSPAIVSLTPGNGSLTATIDAPSSPGGLPITQYSLACSPGNSTTSSANNVVTVTGLANGTSYSCTATATNSAGTSQPSDPKMATPTSVVLISAVLRQPHGPAGVFDLSVSLNPVSGRASVEPRIANTHHLILEFNETILSQGSASVVFANGQSAGAISISGQNSSTLDAALTNIADQSPVRVRILGINGMFDVDIPIAFQIGNVNGASNNEQILSRALTTAADVASLKSRAAQSATVGATNFIFDINRDGVIDARDAAVAKSKSGRGLAQ